MPNRHPYTWLFGAWMIFITTLSLIPLSGLEDEGLDIPYIDKAVHFVFHGVATVLGCLFLREINQKKRSLRQTLYLVVGTLMIYGIIIEVVQYAFTTWRSGDPIDALANTLGALTGAVAITIFYSGDRQQKWKN